MGHLSPKAEMTERILEALGVLSHQKPGGYMAIKSRRVNTRRMYLSPTTPVLFARQ